LPIPFTGGVAPMSCCYVPFSAEHLDPEPISLGRRTLLTRGVPAAVAAPFTVGQAIAAGKTIRIGFCSQLLCAPPYMVTQAGGFFKAEGLDVEIVNLRGSPAVIQALAGGAIEYGASTFEDVLTAAQHGVLLTRFLSTAKLPLSALVVAPALANQITTAAQLEGRTIGEVAAGGPAEVWTRAVMKQAGADGSKVRFATLGPNIYDAVRLGQVDAAWVGEPALTLLAAKGARTLVNFMETDDATKVFGGRYEFMGVSTRPAEAASRHDEMIALKRAIDRGLAEIQTATPADVVRALPAPLLIGLDIGLMSDVLRRYRQALYPLNTRIDVAACERNVLVLRDLGLIGPDITARPLLDLTIANG
jgi:NitT/TauT family transport system substrate-binding protein